MRHQKNLRWTWISQTLPPYINCNHEAAKAIHLYVQPNQPQQVNVLVCMHTGLLWFLTEFRICVYFSIKLFETQNHVALQCAYKKRTHSFDYKSIKNLPISRRCHPANRSNPSQHLSCSCTEQISS